MARGNNVIPNNHFHKKWTQYVDCHFNQAQQAKSRRIKRAQRAAKVAPRPVELVRPVVRCPTNKHNTKVRLGRGFTLEEFKKVFPKKSPKYALSVGIALDHRRTNLSEESLQANVARLQEYKNKLIVFPKSAKKLKTAKYKVDQHAVQHLGAVLPLVAPKAVQQFSAISADQKAHSAFKTLSEAFKTAHECGRALRYAERKAAEAELAAKKKEKE
eukprot:m.919784 g.919784  ORF g.919784 m.919784 type:complete len:215 (+) comp60199_c0_seq1:3222-3866(+)